MGRKRKKSGINLKCLTTDSCLSDQNNNTPKQDIKKRKTVSKYMSDDCDLNDILFITNNSLCGDDNKRNGYELCSLDDEEICDFLKLLECHNTGKVI